MPLDNTRGMVDIRGNETRRMHELKCPNCKDRVIGQAAPGSETRLKCSRCGQFFTFQVGRNGRIDAYPS